MFDWILIGLVFLLIALMITVRRQMIAKIEERTGKKASRSRSEPAVVKKYQELFGADRLYVWSQVSIYGFFALLVTWIFWGSRKFL